MARCRIASPTLHQDEVLAETGSDGFKTYIGLLNEADREGRLEDRPKRLRVQIFPYDPNVNIDAILSALEERGYIVRYTVDGAKFMYLPSFFDFQKPHVRETPSKIPPPPERLAQGDPGASPEHTEDETRWPVSVSVLDPVLVNETVSVSGRETGTGEGVQGEGRAEVFPKSPRGRSKAAGDGRLLRLAREVLRSLPNEDQDGLIDHFLSYAKDTNLKRNDAIAYLQKAAS